MTDVWQITDVWQMTDAWQSDGQTREMQQRFHSEPGSTVMNQRVTYRWLWVTLAFVLSTAASTGVLAQSQETDTPPAYSILERVEDSKQKATSEQTEGSAPQNFPSLNSPNPTEQQIDAGETIDRLLTRLVLDSIPHSYLKDKDWGKTDERWDGIKWKRDGLKISSKRRKKVVNHGTWKKYSAELVDPKNQFSVHVENMRKTENGKTAFDLSFLAHIKLHGRQSKWVKGVQLYSLSADGHAKVRLVVSCELGVTLDITKFPPDLIFSPNATDANLTVVEFRIDRISKAGGEFAQQVTRAVRKTLDEKVDEKEAKLVEKINRELKENKDKLRLSVSDAVRSKFATPAKQFLPEKIQKAMTEQD